MRYSVTIWVMPVIDFTATNCKVRYLSDSRMLQTAFRLAEFDVTRVSFIAGEVLCFLIGAEILLI